MRAEMGSRGGSADRRLICLGLKAGATALVGTAGVSSGVREVAEVFGLGQGRCTGYEMGEVVVEEVQPKTLLGNSVYCVVGGLGSAGACLIG